MNLLFEIELDTGSKYEAYSDESFGLKKGDFCLIKKNKYLDYGKISKFIGNLSTELNNSEIAKIDRKATMFDKSRANENQMRAKSTYRTAVTQVEKLKLKMKLLNVHFTYDRKLVTFLFTAEGRVDFRQLVKELSQILNTRIELRQIGVRDETAVIGGLGTCGQALCCCRFLKKFESINVKMAKEQDLSLNPTNISGMCGRLKCCLKYEHKDYIELDKGMPRRCSSCECAEGVGKIIDRNLLTQKVTVYLEGSGKYLTCPKDEIRVIYPNKYKGISSKQVPKSKKKNNETNDTKKIEHCKKNIKN